jgi:putative ABC transport system ATP-binding protein
MRILALDERPTAGGLIVVGVDALQASARRVRSLRRRALATITQRPTHNLFPHLTVGEHLALMARQRGTAVDPGIAEQLGIGERLGQRPGELSGGEQQRAAVAMAMVGSPPVILADEPTAELDVVTATALVDHLHALAATGTTVVVNTHDPSVIERADRVLTLHHGTMHSERRLDRTLALIDEVGRIQLPPELLLEFPDRQASIERTDDGVLLRRPERDDD